ncbi:hypothetical protein M3Y94_01195600 [Aphelenchoides besseyi]|nr:hypothetical protein M3Y94_01195600 [Aphelenchoides besseyi]KAI6228386.1 DNA topoisomerase [Aphelenchoides besseyi]
MLLRMNIVANIIRPQFSSRSISLVFSRNFASTRGRKKSTPLVIPSTTNSMGRNILCVAEKNDAAKSISAIMSTGRSRIRAGPAKYNKLYTFDMFLLSQQAPIVFTSVSGHLMELEFQDNLKNWRANPIDICFSAQVRCQVPNNMKDIEQQLIAESRKAHTLIIWTDCDREGENIGGEVVKVCRGANPRILVYRARFSEITPNSIQRAIANLQQMDQRQIDAVDCRSELDLRIGAAFTRLQTLYIQTACPNALDQLQDKVVSYGSCQFPTMGFVVDRFWENSNFVTETFWTLKGRDEEKKVDFLWSRDRLFDQSVVEMYLDMCNGHSNATVISIEKKPKSRWRPQPLDTVELEKLGVKKLKITAKRTLAAAEKLYMKGYISYPRTETNMFPTDINLNNLIALQAAHPNWGAFAAEIPQRGGANPRNGRKSDAAHPPIHPLKSATNMEITQTDEWRVYELVVRHFLAGCSRDAKGQETKVMVKINGEIFFASGLIIEDLGYLSVYPYDKWTDKFLPSYQENEVLSNFTITIRSGQTTAPPLLTEADLIALMDKHGIGTDATHAEHIEKIKSRNYVCLNNENRFLPTYMGLSLVDCYRLMGQPQFSKPQLRADLERQLVDICEGRRNKDDVLREQIRVYRSIFNIAERGISALSQSLNHYMNQMPQAQ